MAKILVIMQGHSGSGKSTLAKHIANVIDGIVLSTDDQFMVDGVYQFDPKKLGEAHAANIKLAKEAMDRGENVIIDNTNTQAWEAREYVRYAVSHDYIIRFVKAEGNFKNTHGVPDDVVQKMKDRMEPLSLEACFNAVAPWEKT